jgi:hypothetical protein
MQTTIIYLHLTPKRITDIKSPLDHIYEEDEGGPTDE